MAGEIQFGYGVTGKNVYVVIRNMFGQVWNTAGSAFETFAAANYTDYDVALTEQGATGFYAGDFPTAIVAGVYTIDVRERAGASPAVGDLNVGNGDYPWTKLSLRPRQDDQVWRSQFKKKDLTSTTQQFYADNGSTVEATEVVSDNGTTQVQNAAT